MRATNMRVKKMRDMNMRHKKRGYEKMNDMNILFSCSSVFFSFSFFDFALIHRNDVPWECSIIKSRDMTCSKKIIFPEIMEKIMAGGVI